MARSEDVSHWKTRDAVSGESGVSSVVPYEPPSRGSRTVWTNSAGPSENSPYRHSAVSARTVWTNSARPAGGSPPKQEQRNYRTREYVGSKGGRSPPATGGRTEHAKDDHGRRSPPATGRRTRAHQTDYDRRSPPNGGRQPQGFGRDGGERSPPAGNRQTPTGGSTNGRRTQAGGNNPRPPLSVDELERLNPARLGRNVPPPREAVDSGGAVPRVCTWCGAVGHTQEYCFDKQQPCRLCRSKDHRTMECPKLGPRTFLKCPVCEGVHLGRECPNHCKQNLNC